MNLSATMLDEKATTNSAIDGTEVKIPTLAKGIFSTSVRYFGKIIVKYT